MLKQLKEDINIKSLFSAVMIGNMTSILIPRSGEISRPVLLATKENISKGAVFGSIIVEKIFDLLSILIAYGLSMLIFRKEISIAFSEYNIESVSLYSSIVIIIFLSIILLMIFNLKKTEYMLEITTKKILPKKYQENIHKLFVSILIGFTFIKYPKYYLVIFILTILIWLSGAFSTYITFLAFNINLDIIDANLVFTMMSIATTLPMPGYSAGTFHLFTKITLVSIYGISSEVALGFATVSHLMGLIGILIFGIYYTIKANDKNGLIHLTK
jgi:glycosyltransferase 2 family protein